ncbi:MAG TPA: SDR family NAD(P)-dependent oxidoreductase [Propionibacteriaceae bacterium]|nr:SDR family NAD(P)-dependent oxidoreductase [Propionibacteriaceae bacterium]
MIVVTGGNRGIGFALVTLLADRKGTVIFTSRDSGRGRDALRQLTDAGQGRGIRMEICDLASPDSIHACAQRLVDRGEPIDALINNAGILRPADIRQVTAEGVESTLATNALGPKALTAALEPALAAAPSARVLTLTSRLHQPGSRGDPVDFAFDDPNLERGYSPDRAYKNSKLAAIWVSSELNRRLPATVTADAICPGFVPTTAAAYTTGWQRFLLRRILPRLSFTTTVEQAAADVAWALDAPELAGSGGRYLVDRQVAEPSEDARDSAKARRFWELAATLWRAYA